MVDNRGDIAARPAARPRRQYRPRRIHRRLPAPDPSPLPSPTRGEGTLLRWLASSIGYRIGARYVAKAPRPPSIKHILLRLHQPVVDRLEVEPADVVAADVLAAVAGARAAPAPAGTRSPRSSAAAGSSARAR